MTNDEIINRINRREAIQRVTAMLGGLTLIGGSSLITACEKAQERAADTAKAAAAPQQAIGEFSVQDIAYLDEIADTILPTTQASPGANWFADVSALRPAQTFQPLTVTTHMRSALGCRRTSSTWQTSMIRLDMRCVPSSIFPR